MCLLLLEVALAGQPGWEAEPEVRLGSAVQLWASDCDVQHSRAGQGRSSEHLSENGVLQAPDRLMSFQFSEPVRYTCEMLE